MAKDDAFFAAGAGEWTSPEPGVTRRVMSYRGEMMMVEVVFENGAVGAMHAHPHVQASYVAEGSVDVTIDGVKQTLAKGSSFIVAPNLVHGVVALEPSRLIDVFTPMRETFV